MSFIEKARIALKNFAEKVLDIDNTSIPKNQMDALNDYMLRFNFNTNTSDLNKLVGILRKKHLVDSICVSNSNGSLIVSSNGTDLNQALTGTALFNYIQSEIPNSKAVLIKSDAWYMILPHNKRVYIVKAASDLSPVELRAIANDVEEFFKRNESY